MNRKITLVCIIMLAAIVVGLFQVKHKVQNLRRDLAEINRQLKESQQEIHVLKAEWAYLGEPMRIKKLSDKFLKLQYTSVAQFKDKSEVKIAYAEGGNKYASQAVSPTLKPILSSVKGM